MKNFTFKKIPKTGKYKAFQQQYCDIKLNGKKVGSIFEISNFLPDPYKFSIQLIVRDNESKSGWKNITLKARFDTLVEAQDFLKEKYSAIQNRYDLCPLDE